jgi:hypothetical protein
MDVLWYERIGLPYYEVLVAYAELEGKPPPEPDEEEIALVAAARRLLGKDSDERCARDQNVIEAFHLGRYGHIKYGPTWGHTREELWTNHLNCLFGPGSPAWAEHIKFCEENGFPRPSETTDPPSVIEAVPDSESDF